MSLRETILAAIATKLGTVTGATVYRERQGGIDRIEGPIIILQPEEETVQFFASQVSTRDLMIHIMVFVRSDTPSTTADALLSTIHAALMADQTLGGLVGRIIEHGTIWSFERADVTALEATMMYRIRYLTASSTLSAP